MSNGIISSLASSAKALNTYSRALQVAGNNIANIETEGYARQVVRTGPSQYYDGGDAIRNTGVEVLAIEQVRDPVLDKQIINEEGISGKLNVQKNLLELMENTLGDSIGRLSQLNFLDSSLEDNIGSGLVKEVQNFFTSWSEMAASPELSTSQGVVMQRAVTLTETFQIVSERLDSMAEDIDNRIESDISTASALIDEIGGLNASINRTEIRDPGAAIELRSKRQERLEELAKYLDFQTRENDDRPGTLDIIVTSNSGNAIDVLVGEQRYTDFSSDGTGLQAGTPPVDVDLQSGSISGALAVRGTELLSMQTQLDQAAEQIVASVNAAYNPTAAVDEDFFDPAGTTAATMSLRTGMRSTDIRAADVGAQGGNAIALAVADVQDINFARSGGDQIDGTLRSHLLGMTTELGENVSSVSARVEAQETVQRFLEDQRAAVSGVNLDEEVTNMMRFQRSYQATSRLLRVLDEMLETLVTQL